MKTHKLQARPRSEKGTNACRKLRRSGEVPAVLYGARVTGDRKEAVNHQLAVSAYDLLQLLAAHSHLIEVSFAGQTELALLREVQRTSMGDDIVHVDFAMIDASKPFEVEVELVFKGEAKGLKAGGSLLTEMRNVKVEGLLRALPESVEVRVDDLDIGQAVHVRDLKLPEGVKCVHPEAQVVAHVVAPRGEEEAPTAPAGPAEPEVISKGKKEEGEAS